MTLKQFVFRFLEEINMKIIFKQEDSELVGVIYPEPKFLNSLEGSELDRLVMLANKDLPAGAKYEVVEDDVVPETKEERRNWRYASGPQERTSQEYVPHKEAE